MADPPPAASGDSSPPAAGVSGWARLPETLRMIRFSHTLFALPFALMGAILAADGLPPGRVLCWILVAMVGARSCAMAFNRIADREFDRRNPRTRDRALPAGRLSLGYVAGFAAVNAGLLVLAAAMLNRLALWLSPVALVMILGYSLTKRFTAGSHLFLGLALAGAPVGAWIAVRGEVSGPALLLGGAVLCWTAGFDIIYACQDVAFDRGQGLHSLPARLGPGPALWVSRVLHWGMLLCLVLLIRHTPLHVPFGVGVILAAGILAYEHGIVRPDDLSRVNAAFFAANGWISVLLLAATILDYLIH